MNKITAIVWTGILGVFLYALIYWIAPDLEPGSVLIASIGAVAVYLIVIGLGYDFTKTDFGADTGGTSLRRGPHGDPWNKPSDR